MKGVSEVSPCRIENGYVVEACTGGRRRLPTFALPRVETDVVMVASRGEEYRVLSVPLCCLEAEDTLVKSEGSLQVGDLKVYVPNSSPGGYGRGWIY
jgi:hypothetical protein